MDGSRHHQTRSWGQLIEWVHFHREIIFTRTNEPPPSPAGLKCCGLSVGWAYELASRRHWPLTEWHAHPLAHHWKYHTHERMRLSSVRACAVVAAVAVLAALARGLPSWTLATRDKRNLIWFFVRSSPMAPPSKGLSSSIEWRRLRHAFPPASVAIELSPMMSPRPHRNTPAEERNASGRLNFLFD